MNNRLRHVVGMLCLAGASWAPVAQGNGRMPGATELTVPRSRPGEIVARATFGIVQSFDDGRTWQWVCEAAVRVSGEVDPPTAVTSDGTIVLLPPTGGALTSRDRGCIWEPAPAPLEGNRTIDLTADPSDPARLLVVSSTVDTIDPDGRVSYSNRLMETTDDARSWHAVADLRSDFLIETVEVAPSDPRRLYVTGTASDDALVGIVESSDDGGATWTRSQLPLPEGSGSLYLSGIHPDDPDRLWVRVPARGDSFGLFPASLLMSRDGGRTWEFLADTERAMFGFALSPDGSRLAYGGPADGLFVGPADGSGGFQRVSDLAVRCLEWTESALYACASEPSAPFSLGRSTDEGATFDPIFRMADTCPRSCDDPDAFWATCGPTWDALSPILGAADGTCEAPRKRPDAAGGGDRDATPDASTTIRDAGSEWPGDVKAPGEPDAEASGSGASGGCACRAAHRARFERGAWMGCLVAAAAARRGRKGRRYSQPPSSRHR